VGLGAVQDHRLVGLVHHSSHVGYVLLLQQEANFAWQTLQKQVKEKRWPSSLHGYSSSITVSNSDGFHLPSSFNYIYTVHIYNYNN
jgi:hypothetical protein